MFDSLRIRQEGIMIDEGLLQQLQARRQEYLDTATGSITRTWQIRDEYIPYIRYHERGAIVVELSVPKFLFATNVQMIEPRDIENFWDLLEQRLWQVLSIRPTRQGWRVERLDVCWQFHVGAAQVGRYIDAIARKKIPYLTSSPWGKHTVSFRSKKRQAIVVYDKYAESVSHKAPAEVRDRAKGILRLEVRPSTYELRRYQNARRAHELLTPKFFNWIMESPKVTQLLTFADIQVPDLDLVWLQQHPITVIERILGFQTLLQHFDEEVVRHLYSCPQTFRNRRKEAHSLQLPTVSQLPDLHIPTLVA